MSPPIKARRNAMTYGLLVRESMEEQQIVKVKPYQEVALEKPTARWATKSAKNRFTFILTNN